MAKRTGERKSEKNGQKSKESCVRKKTSKPETIHQCKYCQYSSNNRHNLSRHFEAIHQNQNCNLCNCPLNGRFNLRKHVKKNHQMSLDEYYKLPIPKPIRKRATRQHLEKKVPDEINGFGAKNSSKKNEQKPKKRVLKRILKRAPKPTNFDTSLEQVLDAIPVLVLPIHVAVSNWEMWQALGN